MKNYLSTTKGSFRRTSKTPKTSRRIVRFVIIAIVLIIGLRVVSGVFLYVGELVLLPIRSVDTWLAEGTGSVPSLVRDRAMLTDTIVELESKLQEHQDDAAIITTLEAENELLRTLHAEGADQGERILAGIIGTPGELPYDVFLIDQGSLDGVTLGAAVYSGTHRVIGTVERVMEESAVVVLATTSGVESTVYIIGPNIYTTAVGVGGGILQVNVPQGIPIEVGQPVIFPGVSGGIFGEIAIVDPRPTRPAQYAYVHTNTPILSTRLVSVSKKAPATLTFEEAQVIVSNATQAALQVPVPPGTLVEISTSTATSSPDTASTTTLE